MVPDLPHCEAHDAPTRLTCAECGAPICPRCLVRTDVGLRCERCASPGLVRSGGRPRRRLVLAVGTSLAGLALLGVVLALTGALGGETPRGQAATRAVGTWERARPLQSVRGSTSAVALPGGSVMVVGGGVGSMPIAASEVFDPATGDWSRSGRLEQARRGHRAVVLADDSQLVAGGIAGSRLLASAERHGRSAESSWTAVGKMSEPRLGHTLTVLPDGRVLATGGTGGSAPASEGGQTVRPVASGEIFDPESRRWTATGAMRVPRFEHTASLLRDGRVLIAGGLGARGGETVPVGSAELYDPETGTFSPAAEMDSPRTDHAAVRLQDGRVLVSGGDRGTAPLASAEIFDPARGTWSRAPSLAGARRGHSATLLKDGTVLVAGGERFSRGARSSLASAERFDPGRGLWRSAGRMSCARSEQAAALLPDGSVLVAGGDAAFPGEPPRARRCADRYRP